MFRYNVRDEFIRSNPWVKKILRKENPESLAKLIEKRLTNSITGPWICERDGEISTDIFTIFCKDELGFKEKFEPALGLLLFQILENEKAIELEHINKIFYCITECKLNNCAHLVYRWIQLNYSILVSNLDYVGRPVFKNALYTLAKIQKHDEILSAFWHNLWKESDQYWKSVAFLGLRIQNAKAAAAEIPNLIKFNHEHSAYMLCGMWSDENSKHQLECAIKNGLKSDQDWAHKAAELIIEKLKKKDIELLLSKIK